MKESIIKRRMQDLSEISDRRGQYTFTSFLTPAEHSEYYEIENTLPPVGVTAWGGYADAERVMLRFGCIENLGYEQAFPICCVRISPLLKKFADKLSHRDVLGAVMHLGIERQEIGDILVGEAEAYLFASDTMAEYICRELETVKHTSVRCTIVETPVSLPNTQRKTEEIQAASERIDGVISKIFRLSRSECNEFFRRGLIFVNDRAVTNHSIQLKTGDKVSVRGKGKFIFRGVIGQTRKGNLILQVEQYV